jgi:Tol biopolymer transport system component/DNA-binding winged helix-turn-helix (wHTH) protein
MENPTECKRSVCFAEFELDLRTGELRSNSQRTILQEKPFKILAALLDRPGEMVTRDELIKRLWPADTFVDFNLGLNKAVNRLREVLNDSADQPRFIETFPKRGYRFMARVISNEAKLTEMSASPIQADDKKEPGDKGTSVSPPVDQARISSPSTEVPHARRSLRSVVIAMVAVAAALLGVYMLRARVSRSRTPDLEKFQVTKLTDSGKVELAAISADGRFVTYALRERGGVGLWLHQLATHSDVRILSADAVGFEGLTFSPDGNYIYYVRADSNDPGFKYLYVMPALGGSSRLLIKDIDSPVSFSPDGQHFVYTRGIPIPNATDVRVANADGSGDHLLARIKDIYPGFQPGATWSPDGRTIAVSLLRYGKQSFVLYAVSVPDGSEREIYSSSRAVGRPLWLPEGDTLLLVMHDRNGRGQLWTVAYPKAEVRRVTNDLTNYRTRADLTRDAKTMVAIANSGTSNIWVAPATNLSQAQQITSIALPLFEVVEAPDGRLLAAGQDGKIWTLRPDGSERNIFVDVEDAGQPASCGRYVVFSSYRTTTTQLMRVDANGSDIVTLARGDLGSLVCSADGKYVFYEDLGPPHRINRIPVEGGAPLGIATVLGEFLVGRLSISPDGKRLAYPYEEYSPAPILKLAVISSEGGSTQKIVTAPGGAYAYGSLLWSPDGNSLQYILSENGASNIWEQPLGGGKPRQLTTFSSGEIFDFHWSRDGKRLLLTRGEVSSDAVLISSLR